jgi:hypothetical protein
MQDHYQRAQLFSRRSLYLSIVNAIRKTTGLRLPPDSWRSSLNTEPRSYHVQESEDIHKFISNNLSNEFSRHYGHDICRHLLSMIEVRVAVRTV